MDTALYSPVLAALAPDELATLLDKAVPRNLEQGDILFLAGEEARRVYLVERGVMKLTCTDGEGRETIVGLAVEGDLVGDIAATDREPQPFDAVAATKSLLVAMDADAFRRLVASRPAASLALAATISSRLRSALVASTERSSSEVPARLAGRLLELADLLGRMKGTTIEVDLPLDQAELGRLAGMCRESTCKTLRRFRSEGVVEYRGRRLRILRPDALARIRCGGRAS